MRAGLTGLVAGALACAPAAAEPPAWMLPNDAIPARLVAVGTWDFAATRRGPDGRPECTERWTFNADGSGLIVSGEQRSEIIWKAIRDESIGQFIYIASAATNGRRIVSETGLTRTRTPKASPAFSSCSMAPGQARWCAAKARSPGAPMSRFTPTSSPTWIAGAGLPPPPGNRRGTLHPPRGFLAL